MVSRVRDGVARRLADRDGQPVDLAGGMHMAHYGAAKGALNSLSKGMAVELGRYGIRVNVVAVGIR